MPPSSEDQDRNLWLRGKTYYCRVEVNGRSERVSLRTGDIIAARKERDKLVARAAQVRAGHEPEPTHTWEAAVVAYAAAVLDRPGALSPSTAERYRDSIRKIGSHFAGKPVAEINAKLIGRLVAARQQEGVTNATIRRDLTALSRILAFAAAQGLRDGGNPARDYDRSFLPEAREVIRPPTDEQIATAVHLVSDAREQWPLLVRWLRATGMRLTEALAARRAEIEVVTENRRRLTRLSLYRVKGARRGRMRTITLGAEAVAILARLGPDLLFAPFDPERSDNVSTQWLKFRHSREGMPYFRLHDLRHAYAVAELRADPTCLYRLSRHLGHSSVQTTERHYLRFLSDEQQHSAKFGASEPTPSQKPSQAVVTPKRKARTKAPQASDNAE